MLLGVNMLDLYVNICDKTLEVIILDSDVLCVRLHLRINYECDFPLIVFVNCDWISKILHNTVGVFPRISIKN